MERFGCEDSTESIVGLNRRRKMQVIDKMSALKLLCNLSNKWGMYIACTCPEEDIENMCAAAPYLSWEDDQHIQVISNGEGYLLFGGGCGSRQGRNVW
jgi:hypothetical protein